MCANSIKLIWVETPSTEVPLFSVICQTDQIICRFKCQFELFSDQLNHFESQFGNMYDLLLAFAYNVKTIHFQPSSNKVFQPKKNRCDDLCLVIRMLGEQLLQLLSIRENSISPENSFEGYHGKRTSVFLHISSKLGMQYAETQKNDESESVTAGHSEWALTFLQGIWCQRYKPQSILPIPLSS